MKVHSECYTVEGNYELDTHEDTIAAGNNITMIDDPNEVLHYVDVSPFLRVMHLRKAFILPHV